MKKLIILSVLITWVALAKAQNQYNMTQYMLQHAFINPAATAAGQNLDAALFYRNQWTQFDGAPVMQGLNANYHFKDEKNNVGTTVLHDKIGVNNNFYASGTYAYRLNFEKSHLCFGASASVSMLQSDFNQVYLVDDNDPVFSSNTPRVTQPNFKFGTYYYTDKFYVGFAIPNLLENKIVYENAYKGKSSFNPKDMHLYLQGGYRFKLNEKMSLNTSTLIKQVSGAPMQIDLNTQLAFNGKFSFGASFRTSKEVIALLGFNIKEYCTIGYAYDLNLDKIGNYSSGTHEIMIVYPVSIAKETAAVRSPRF
jgi:type IX secretion system PorP/SprF family membrane protein